MESELIHEQILNKVAQKSAFSAKTYVHIDSRKDNVIRLSTSADPEREDESYSINQELVTIPNTDSRNELFEKLITDFFKNQSNGSSIQTQSVTTTSIEVLTNETRIGASFVNASNTDAYILLGSGAASLTNYTVKLSSGGDDIYELPYNYSGAVQVVFTTSGSGNLIITKFN